MVIMDVAVEVPSVAVIVALLVVPKSRYVNDAELVPAEIRMVAGTTPAAAGLTVNGTCTPPGGAGRSRVTDSVLVEVGAMVDTGGVSELTAICRTR